MHRQFSGGKAIIEETPVLFWNPHLGEIFGPGGFKETFFPWDSKGGGLIFAVLLTHVLEVWDRWIVESFYA